MLAMTRKGWREDLKPLDIAGCSRWGDGLIDPLS
jgi:hypothetical protein